ncbi:ABC transporter ATPase [Robertkochia aurantiaca]|uniref:ABC transporter ATPase n=1 Tax=Robertkochia aurantiaca TaxID=2873700 RepID=UPI001CCE0749|nr:ABC transporter ATPase [Robertkochia sp. 3YJGBD-33]
MLVDFEKLPEDARIWIYQANRTLTDEETEAIKQKLENFLQAWTAHGSGLEAGYEIRYKRFIVIGLDQDRQAATGCSIDASVHFIQELEKEYNIDLLDKMNVSYRQGDFIAYKPLADFKKMAKQKAVSQNTIVFNNLVNNKEEYQNYWEVPARDSWHVRFMN